LVVHFGLYSFVSVGRNSKSQSHSPPSAIEPGLDDKAFGAQSFECLDHDWVIVVKQRLVAREEPYPAPVLNASARHPSNFIS
jgi:hypothetical protein